MIVKRSWITKRNVLIYMIVSDNMASASIALHDTTKVAEAELTKYVDSDGLLPW